MGISVLGATCITDPDSAKAAILSALTKSRGDRGKAAKALETTQRNLYRVIDRLAIWGDIDKLVADRGFPIIPGPLRSNARIRVAVLDAQGNLKRAARRLDMVDERTLRQRIEKLSLWDELDQLLAIAGLPPLKRGVPALHEE
jgi:hypothetical protein